MFLVEVVGEVACKGLGEDDGIYFTYVEKNQAYMVFNKYNSIICRHLWGNHHTIDNI